MPRTIDLMLAAVRLDWRLSVAAARAEPDAVLLPALVGALLLWNLAWSAMSTALLAQADPAFGTAILSTYAWTTAVAAAGLALAVGQPALAQRVTDHLRIAPVSVPQMFLALQALTGAGRYLGIAGLVSIPLGLLVVTLLPPHRAAAVGGAWLVVLWMLPGLIRAVSAILRRLSYRTLFVLGTGAATLAALSNLSAVGPNLLAALPPGVMVRIAAAGSTPASWLLLAGWATLFLLLDYRVLSWRESRVSVRTGSHAVSEIPSWSRTVSRLCRVPPTLLYGELLRLLRWRSFALWGIGGSILLAMVYSSMNLPWERSPLHVLSLLLPPLLASGVMANMFATDRAGVQAYFLCVSDLRSVLRAKCVAVGVFVAAAEVVIVGLILLQGARLEPAHLFAPVAVAGFFVWATGIGLVVSILFPRPIDPHRPGRGILSAPAAVVTLLADGFMAGLVMAGAFLFGTERAAGIPLMAVAAAIIVLAGMAARLLPRVAHRLLHTRRERLTMELALNTRVA